VYLSLSWEVAAAEAVAHQRYFGIPEHAALPRTFVGVRLGLARVLDLSNGRLRQRLGFSVRKIADLEKGVATKASTDQRLAEVSRLQQGLSAIMKAEFVGEWLRMPTDAFDGLKPLEVIERGEVDRLWRMIYLLESGLPV